MRQTLQWSVARRRHHAPRAALPDGGVLLRAGLSALCLLLAVPAQAQGEVETVLQTVNAVCGEPFAEPGEMAARIPGAGPDVSEDALTMRGIDIGWKRRFVLRDGAEFRVERFAPQGQLRRLTVEYWSPASGTDNPVPRLAAIAGADCSVSHGRRLVYESDEKIPSYIIVLGDDLQSEVEREPLNPAVPEGDDPGGIPVAHVDSGVNYLLPGIAGRLARDESGTILGYDFWDMDRRPFDSHPAQSPFFPQRHGTRTAALLLREAPEARLVPYRYPRPDMARMRDLIADADASGVRIVNISMGSDDRSNWEAFAAAAGERPEMLFVISAGNNGWDIDRQPIYPASLALENTIVVSSSLSDGRIAQGSNWGAESVDLLVPAERLLVMDFDGNDTVASGSSYAAIRVSALAARMLASNPDWTAGELKTAISERVLPAFGGSQDVASMGFLPRPEITEHLPPLLDDSAPRELSRQTLTAEELYPDASPAPLSGYALALTLAYFDGTGWRSGKIGNSLREAADILAQCRVHVRHAETRLLDGPPVYHYFHDLIGTALVEQLALPKPTVYFVTDTLQVEPYDAEAIGRSNSRTRPALQDTVWLTAGTRDPGIALAHELVHVLMDSGAHVEEPGNLMRSETSPSNTELTAQQCEAIVSTGTENGLLEPVNR